jgi:hypothetical protein
MNPTWREERAKSASGIRARIVLIAAERGLSKFETNCAGRLNTYDLYLFSRRHRVDIEWLDHRPAPRVAQDHPRAASSITQLSRPPRFMPGGPTLRESASLAASVEEWGNEHHNRR